MNKYTIILSCFALSVLAACSSKKLATTTPAAETPAVSTLPPEQAEGKTIFQGKCGSCHTLFPPSSRNVASWEKILPPMARKAKLTDDEAAKVHAYVMAHAKK